MGKLKEYSKSNKPSMCSCHGWAGAFGAQANSSCLVWEVAAEDEKRTRDGRIAEQVKLVEEMQKRKEEIRKSGQSLVPGGSL